MDTIQIAKIQTRLLTINDIGKMVYYYHNTCTYKRRSSEYKYNRWFKGTIYAFCDYEHIYVKFTRHKKRIKKINTKYLYWNNLPEIKHHIKLIRELYESTSEDYITVKRALKKCKWNINKAKDLLNNGL